MNGHLLIHTTITLLYSIAFLPQVTFPTPPHSSTIPSATSENTKPNGLKLLAEGIQQFERNQISNSINTLTQARDILETTSSHTLERASCMMYLSRAHARLKQDTEAKQLSTSALELFNNIENTIREQTICKRTLAICNYHQGHNEEALSELEHVLVTFCDLPHSEPDQRICLLNMREILSLIQDDSARKDRSRKIIENLKQALSRPHLSAFIQAYLNLNIGWVFAEIREHEEAKSAGQQALALFEQIPDTENDQAMCHYDIGRNLDLLGKTEESLSEFRIALDLQIQVPNNERETARCASITAKRLSKLGLHDEAIKIQKLSISLYQKAPLNRSDIPKSYVTMGDIFLAANQPTQALMEYQKALELYLNHSGTQYEQSKCYKMIAEAQKAMKSFEEAIKSLEYSYDICKEITPSTGERADIIFKKGTVMEAQGKYADAIPFYQQASHLCNGIPALCKKQALYKCCLGNVAQREGKYEEALQAYYESLDVYEKDPLSAEMQAICLDCIGRIYSVQGLHSESIEARQEALKLYHNDISKSKEIGRINTTLSYSFSELNRFEEADRHARVAIDVLSKSPSNKNNLFDAFYMLAYCLDKSGQLSEAEKYYKESIDLAPETIDMELLTGKSYKRLGEIFIKNGSMSQAMDYFQEAQLCFSCVSSQQRLEAECLSQLARCALNTGNYSDAYKYGEAALILHRQVSGNDSEELHTLPFIRGYLLEKMNRQAESIEAFHEALLLEYAPVNLNESERKQFIDDNERFTRVLKDRALEAFRERKPLDDTRFNKLLTRFQSVISTVNIPEIIDVMDSIDEIEGMKVIFGKPQILTLYLKEMLNESESEPERIIEIIIQKYGDEDAKYWLPSAYIEVASRYQNKGDLNNAMEYLQKALAICKGDETNRDSEADTLCEIGWLHRKRGEIEIAKELFMNALNVIQQSDFSMRTRINILTGLGVTLRDIGDYVGSRKVLKQAIDASSRYTSMFPLLDIPKALGEIGWTYMAEGDNRNALLSWFELLKRQYTITIRNLPVMTLKQKTKLTNAKGDWIIPSHIYSVIFDVSCPPDFLGVVGYGLVLWSKGIVAESTRIERGSVLKEATSEWRQKFDQYVQLKVQLASASQTQYDLNMVGLSSIYSGTDNIQRLQKQITGRELELARKNNTLWKKMQLSEVQPQDIQNILPKDSILLEYIKYWQYDFKQQEWDGERYGVFVVPSTGEPILAVPLGSAEEIDASITRLRTTVEIPINESRHPSRGDERAFLREATHLRQLILDPVQSKITNSKRIFIAPDGDIGLVPFECLPTDATSENKGYLVEQHEIIYLTTGRDLVRETTEKKIQKSENEPNQVLLVGAPDYNLPPIERAKMAGFHHVRLEPLLATTPHEATPDESTKPVVMGEQQPQQEWKTLPHLLPSLKALSENLARKLPNQVTTLSGSQATEESLRQYPSPRILHISTHGHFVPEDNLAPPLPEHGDDASRQEQVNTILRDTPLLRSMLVLAGANRREEDTFYLYQGQILSETEAITLTDEERAKARFVIGDGLLTALEAADLNLQGTELVSLIACKSGVGVPETGNGIAGLRQAFILAGAQSVIMSLWDVPVEESLAQTTTFYTHWLDGQGKYKAFRKSQLKALEDARTNRGCGHPFYWAGFIYAGQP